MQLMQPKPHVPKPMARRPSMSPERSSKSSVAWLPGANTVFTHGLGAKPSSAARFATRPHAIIMRGSVAVVQLVTAAIAMAPCVSACSSPPRTTVARADSLRPRLAPTCQNRPPASAMSKRSCGRDGPDIEGFTEPKSSSMTSEYTRSSPSSSQRPCCLAYASTSATCASERPVMRRKSSVCPSTGNSVHVLPYSGVMLEMQARCVADRFATPGPKHSTKQPTTPLARSVCANVRATSMAATPSASRPVSFTPITRGTSVVMGWPSAAASASMPPTPQPSTPMPLAVGVCESTTVSKYASGSSPPRIMTTLAKFSMFSWWQMPCPGGTMRTFSNESCAHFRKL